MSQKVMKWTKEGYSDHSCRGIFYLSFFFHFQLFRRFSCPLYFLRNKFTLVPQTFSWVFVMSSQTNAFKSASVLHIERFRGI